MGGKGLRLVGSRAARIAVPVATVVLATASAIVTNVLTTDWAWVWWPVLGVLVVLNVLLLVRIGPSAPLSVTAEGPGSVAAGGSIQGNTKTTVRGSARGSRKAAEPGVAATGAGSVAAGADIVGDTTTDVG